MLSKRLAQDVRDLFSTVGPSPYDALSTTLSLTPKLLGGEMQVTNPSPTLPQNAPSRLVLLPPPNSQVNTANAVPARGVPTLFIEVLATTAHRSASFFAEAAVLVLVLGILDRYLALNRLEPRWIAGAFLIALGLLAASIATDVTARRWLRAH